VVALGGAPVPALRAGRPWLRHRWSRWWGCTGARQTVAAVDADGAPLGPGILWSDRTGQRPRPLTPTGRGAAPGPLLLLDRRLGGGQAGLAGRPRRRPVESHPLDPHPVTWWCGDSPARWPPTPPWPRVRRLYDARRPSGGPSWPVRRIGLLPPVVDPGPVITGLSPEAAAALGLAPGTPVVIGAGRPSLPRCWAPAPTDSAPWSAGAPPPTCRSPVAALPEPGRTASCCRRAAEAGWLLEGGLSAAGSLLDLARQR
jgi:hypothetical protein